ncbi:MAG: putative dsRNA-binding protein, partial [Gammaproteobacteria bacterium]|nr:putative dsRNA-binding protein [Gammaproteobacteria bacterium]
KDPKTRLQELLQSRKLPIPVYQVLNVSGKAHAQTFTVRCSIDKIDCVTQADGGSRRKAEQLAAEAAFQQVKQKLNA